MSSNEQEKGVVAGDKTKGAKYIAEHPEEYGFTWDTGALGRGTGVDYKELRADCPWINVKPEQVTLFTLTFGSAFIADVLKGQSIKVRCDRVNRAAIEKDGKITTEQLREKLVTSILLQMITRSGFATTKYVVNGQVFASQQDADKFAANAERIKQLESAQAFLAMAADNGIDPVVTRNMAKQQWPLAFMKDEQDEGADESDNV